MCDVINNNKKKIEKERSIRWVLEIVDIQISLPLCTPKKISSGLLWDTFRLKK